MNLYDLWTPCFPAHYARFGRAPDSAYADKHPVARRVRASGVGSSGPAVPQPSTARQSGEIWRSDVLESIKADYGACLVDALVRHDESEPSAVRLVRRAQDDCSQEAVAWREYHISQGRDRRWFEGRFAEGMEMLAESLAARVVDYRARGIPLAELADEM